MRVLILNRRDIANPMGGGAEVYTHEIAQGMVRRGEKVTVLASAFRGCAAQESLDGVRYVRRGNELTVHLHGFMYAMRRHRELDLIVDQYNGLGFFCFLLPRSMMLIHQMYRGFWLRELGPVLGGLPYMIEPWLLRCYHGMPTVAVSDSTRGDLADLGFRDVQIVMNALSNKPLSQVPRKEPRPTLMFLGRLRSTKRPEDTLEIFAAVSRELPDAQLWIVGSGPMEAELRQRARGLGDVTFFGHCTDPRKFELLSRAHLLLAPGVREGFGINVIEAASMGTPAIGYDIHGLRDSIRDGYSGLLARGPQEAAIRATGLLKDRSRYAAYAGNCLEYARGFSWEARSGEFHMKAREIAARLRQSAL